MTGREGEKLRSQEAGERWELLPHGLVLVSAWGETKDKQNLQALDQERGRERGRREKTG